MTTAPPFTQDELAYGIDRTTTVGGLIDRLVRGGCDPDAAAATARTVLDALKAKERDTFWFVARAADGLAKSVE